MVCFEIEIAYPYYERDSANVAYAQRIEHLRKHYQADVLQKKYKGDMLHLSFAICDDEAVGFLRDLPQPTFCVKITFLRSDILLYSNYKYTNVRVKPPKYLFLKRVYWTASSLEKWQLPL